MSLPTNINASVTTAIESFIFNAQRYRSRFGIPDHVKINASNFEIQEMFDELIFTKSYELLYTAYVSDIEGETLYIPKTWFDYVKHGLKEKFPKLFGFLKINYDTKKTITKTFFPQEKVMHPMKRVHYVPGLNLPEMR